jgi:NAD(P)-dependent dehydrogenase (short-subunit alcohol dehydrogenase family)
MAESNTKIVLITGASGALGGHVVEAFRAAGAQAVASSLNAGIRADLTKAAEANALAEEAVRRFGRVDALVHATGGFAGGQPIHETADETWESMLNVNLRASWNILRAVLPYMRRERRGSIVAIGSRAGVEPAANIAAYSASKAALISLVRTAALENRDAGITANVILPGTIDTEANRRANPNADRSNWVSPRRIAELCVFLTSDAAAEVTGAAIPVYGAGL